jgi:hypothetical protein
VTQLGDFLRFRASRRHRYRQRRSKIKPQKPSSGLRCVGNPLGDGVARRSGPRSRPCHQVFVRHQALTRRSVRKSSLHYGSLLRSTRLNASEWFRQKLQKRVETGAFEGFEGRVHGVFHFLGRIMISLGRPPVSRFSIANIPGNVIASSRTSSALNPFRSFKSRNVASPLYC